MKNLGLNIIIIIIMIWHDLNGGPIGGGATWEVGRRKDNVIGGRYDKKWTMWQ
jgi:hypothetical protein